MKLKMTLFVIVLFTLSALFGARTSLPLQSRKDVSAWGLIGTGQSSDDDGTHDDFKSVVVLPSGGTTPSGDTWTEDQVYCVVERDINNSTVTFIEQFTPIDWGTDDDYAWFVDCGAWGNNRYQPGVAAQSIPAALGNYPTLRTTTSQADPGLTHTTAVSNVTDLQNMNNNKAGNYYLTGDIDASATSGWNGGAGFVPVGSAISPFTGTFDGCGYTITGLTINRASTNYIGLFGNARNTAQIANVTVASASIVGQSFVGVLAGAVDNGGGNNPLVQNCNSSGTITLPADAGSRSYLGGLIGYVQGKKSTSASAYVYDCSSSVAIDGTNITGTLSYVGGLIGFSEQAIISNCYATGNVNLGSDPQTTRAGGFIGILDELTQISYSYATGDVTAYDQVGGFMGAGGSSADEDGFSYIRRSYSTGDVTSQADNAGGFNGVNSVDIVDCYAWGDVTIVAATGDVGGFTGTDFVPSSPDYDQCYSIGAVSGGDNQGGFVATSQTGTYTECCWDTQTSGQATSDEGTGHTTTWLKTNPNYPETWDFDTIWYQYYTAAYEIPAVAEAWSSSDDDELDGASVCVYADGDPHGTFTMDGNDISGFTEADHTVVIRGLNYWSKLETLPLKMSWNPQLGLSPGELRLSDKQLTSIKFDLEDTYLFSYGMGADSTVMDANFAEIITSVVQYKRVAFPFGSRKKPTIYIEVWEPVPLGIRGIYPDITWYEQ